MKNEYDMQDIENFKINPHVWLQTLLAIAGDTEKKKEVIQIVAQQSELPFEEVETIFGCAIKVLVNETRSN
jgi:hypothetical protein